MMNLNIADEKFNILKIGKLGFVTSFVSILFLTIILVFLQSMDLLIYTSAILVIIPFSYVLYKYPKYWIYTVLLVFPYYTQDSDTGTSVSDVLIGIFYLFSLLLWFIDALLISKKRIIYEITDFILILIFVLSFFTCIYTIEVDTTFFNWLKEYSRFFIVLYYFPIRYYFFQKEDSKFILYYFMLMIFLCDIIQIGKYYFYLNTNLVYAYQLSNSERINQILYTTAIPAIILFIFNLKSKLNKGLFAIIIISTIAALISTLSRTFWVATIINILIVFLYLSFKNKFKLLIFSFVFSLVLVGSSYYLFQNKFKFIVKFIELRFSSTGNASKDISLQARYVEWDKIWDYIIQYPFGGVGYSHVFQFHSPLIQEILRTTNIHNGFLYLMYRIGIPLTFAYSFLFFYGMAVCFYLTFKFKDNFYKPLSIATFLGYFSMITTNYTSAQFFYRDSFFVTAFLFFCSSICYLEYKRLLNDKQILLTEETKLNG